MQQRKRTTLASSAVPDGGGGDGTTTTATNYYHDTHDETSASAINLFVSSSIISMDLPQGISEIQTISPTKAEMRLRSRLTTTTTTSWAWIVSFGVVLTVCVGGYIWLINYEVPQLRYQIEHDEMEPLTQEWQTKYNRLLQEHELLQNNHTQLLQDHEELKDSYDEAEVECDGERDLLLEKLDNLHEAVQEYSKRIVWAKFGPGPHRVQVQVAYDPNGPEEEVQEDDTEKDTTTTDILVLELAPVEEMPHAVYWFLEQVSQGLYDGCSFHRNAHHVLQGGPAPNFLSPANPNYRRRFRDAGLLHVLFQEYSDDFPHEKYTLGYAGRPGGPDIYINLHNNTRVHGPGGQEAYSDPSEADPCFAKVIEGFETVNRMHRAPVKEGGYRAFVSNIAITSMKLLEQQQDVGRYEDNK